MKIIKILYVIIIPILSIFTSCHCELKDVITTEKKVEINKEFLLTTEQNISFSLDFAKVIVKTYDGLKIKVSIQIKAPENIAKNYIISDKKENSTLYLKSEINNKSEQNNHNCEIIVTMFIPENKIKNINIDNGAGNIEIENIKAETIKLKTGAGKIITNDAYAIMKIEIGAGEITVNGVDNITNLSTGAGNIKISNVNNNEGINAFTGAGSIEAEFDSEIKAKLIATTGVGHINIDSQENISNIKKSKDVVNEELTADINSGSKVVKLETGVGSICISFK